jgi:hypothetical protein
MCSLGIFHHLLPGIPNIIASVADVGKEISLAGQAIKAPRNTPPKNPDSHRHNFFTILPTLFTFKFSNFQGVI